MPEQLTPTTNTPAAGILSAPEQKGGQSGLFAQILEEGVVAQKQPESVAAVRDAVTTPEQDDFEQLVTELRALFSNSDELEGAMEGRQLPLQSGNQLPPSSEEQSTASLLKKVDELPPEQFDELMLQLPEMAALLKSSPTVEGHPTLLNVTLKNITVVNGQLVSGRAAAKEQAVLTTEGMAAETAAKNPQREQRVNLQASGHSATVSATQYRAQQLHDSRNNSVDKVATKGDSTLATSLETGLGNKAQQHDRLMATLSVLRQELATDRRSLDSRVSRSTEQLSRSLLSEVIGEGDGYTTLSSPLTSQQAVTTHISLPVPHPRWGNAVSEKVVWMMTAQIKEAAIKLNPASLGSIEIKISLADDQASVAFNVHNSQAKEALESALPRLREMLAESGIALNDTHVSDQSEQQSSEQHESASNTAHLQGEQLAHDETIARGVIDINTQQGVDIYI